mgnify:CR=1 FL=1
MSDEEIPRDSPNTKTLLIWERKTLILIERVGNSKIPKFSRIIRDLTNWSFSIIL